MTEAGQGVGPRGRVSLLSLKQFAVETLSRESALREVILGERDEVEAEKFVAKIGVWLKLLRHVKI